MYTQSFDIYDTIYQLEKDYSIEAEKIDYLLQQLPANPTTILDVACGSGEHAHHLYNKFKYSVDGIDIEPGFVEIAQKKNPSGVFIQGDMSNFDIGRKYDVVLCLFSSIGYVQTKRALCDTLTCIAKHLNSSGYLILEPWLEPTNDLSSLSTIIEAVDPKTKIQVTRKRSAYAEENISVLDIEYSIKLPKETKQFKEQHRLGMFSREEMAEAFQQAELIFTYAEQGLHNKGIYLAKLAV
ncbi:methyltransferase domain-containing protein [Puniceicoccaceae bacterium K14]|nr:methyltransferase domain-containing protein [Puniceicoccaceae bacterium K14]